VLRIPRGRFRSGHQLRAIALVGASFPEMSMVYPRMDASRAPRASYRKVLLCGKQLLGDKKSLERQIHEVTGISLQALRGHSLAGFSVSERFSWAASRNTQKAEDQTYSLLGMLDVYMPLLYGEGKNNAFRQMQEEIGKLLAVTNTSKTLSTFVNPMELISGS
jgi:hypothetical protein